MPFYPREVCENVRAANDIVDVVSSYIKLERRGGRYFGLCPFHNEKTGSFCVNSDSQLYYCFGCHASGNVVSFLMSYENMEYTEAIEMLADRAGIKIESQSPTNDDKTYRQKRDLLLAANKEAAMYYYKLLRGKEGERGLRYFKERGLSNEILNSFGLGYTGLASGELYAHLKAQGFSDEILMEAGLILFDEKKGVRDRFFNRVMFPIMDANRKVIGFGARVLGDGQPKYLNSAESPIFKKSDTLYGLFAARRSRRKELILCEGYMDVISSHMAGFDNAVATLGTALTEGHAAIIARMKRPVLLCYDTDGAGRNAARRGYEILKSAGISAKIMDLSPYKDPDELVKAEGREELLKRVEGAKNAFLTIMSWDYAEVDKADPDAMGGFVHKLSQGIASFKDEALRESYIENSARIFSIKPDLLRRQVNGMGGDLGLTPAPLRARKKDSGVDRQKALRNAEGTLLYYLFEGDFYVKCRGLLERDDFSEDVFRDIYDEIAESMETKRQISPADIISTIEDEQMRTFLSGIFFSSEAEEGQDKAKLKKSALLRVKKASIQRENKKTDPSDVANLQQALEYAKETIEEIENIKF